MDGNKIFEANRDSILLISQIVSAVREQHIYTCATKMKTLIGYLQTDIEEMGTRIWSSISIEELSQILQAIIEAQENDDYVLLADILEGDLRPFLQKFQMEILEKEDIEYTDWFEKNLEALRQKDEYLCNLIEHNRDITEFEYTLIPAINGQITMHCCENGKNIYMHSMLDPGNAAREFARAYYDETQKKYCIWGLGLGYHITALLEKSKTVSVVVLETNLQMIVLAMKFQDWAELLAEGRIEIRYEKRLEKLLKNMEKNGMFLIHYPSLQILPASREKEILENYFVSTNSMREQKQDMDDNFYRLQKFMLPECQEVVQKITGSTLVIVAAGPSLEREISALKEVQAETVILSVGTVAQNLIVNEIYPDFILITDAWEQMYKQIENIGNTEIPLLLLSTASAEAANCYKGPCYLVYQEGYMPAEKIAHENQYMLFRSGGSVITLAVDMGIRLAARKMILLGADMAYTDHRLHAFETTDKEYMTLEMREVDGIDGKKVKTGKNLDIYRKWIENRIKDKTDVEIYNSSYGARIRGTKEMSLREALSDE